MVLFKHWIVILTKKSTYKFSKKLDIRKITEIKLNEKSIHYESIHKQYYEESFEFYNQKNIIQICFEDNSEENFVLTNEKKISFIICFVQNQIQQQNYDWHKRKS